MEPENIFQILISSPAIIPGPSLGNLERNIQSFKDAYPKANYRQFDDKGLKLFLANNFTKDVLRAYCSLRPSAFKADLARYCLLYNYGGLYSDLSYLHIRPIIVPDNTKMIVFRDIGKIHPAWSTSNAIIYSRPRHPVMQRAINRIVEYSKVKFYGNHPLEPTGPYMFGRVLADELDWSNILFGDSELINIDATGRYNIVKVMPAGEVVAFRNKTNNSSIGEFINGGDSYSDLWHDCRAWY